MRSVMTEGTRKIDRYCYSANIYVAIIPDIGTLKSYGRIINIPKHTIDCVETSLYLESGKWSGVSAT